MHSPSRKKVIKQGWVYKKGSFFQPWRLKWFVLLDQPSHSVHIYNHRDQNTPPKYIISLSDLEIEVPHELQRRHVLDREKLYAFVLVTKHKRFVFGAQSKKERDEWINTLQQASGKQNEPRMTAKIPDDCYSQSSVSLAPQDTSDAASQITSEIEALVSIRSDIPKCLLVWNCY
ncbi:hypothetical protein BKA69DRAFT_669005 [Paraphysoderma sedebokerense]|nr:hypothetical protein BKA69DRAFT_669005 [Paraphysoderma sedebokerense]